MKYFNKKSLILLCLSGTIVSTISIVSCSQTKDSNQDKMPIKLPNFKEGAFDYSVEKIPKSELYRFHYNRDKLKKYSKQGSENISDPKQKQEYIHKRSQQYIEAWRYTFDEYKKDFNLKAINLLSKNKITLKKELKNFSLDESYFENIPKSLPIEFLGKQAILKFQVVSYSVDESKYFQNNLDENVRSNLVKELEIKNDFPISVNFNYSLSFEDKKIQDFQVSYTEEFKIHIGKTIKELSDNLKINFDELPKTSVNWNEPKIKEFYFDGELAAEADGDTFSVKVTNNNNLSGINNGDIIRVRLSGIDTPEKASGRTLSSPFENSFAIISSKFASKLMKTKLKNNLNVGQKLRVAFINGKDAFGRTLGDVFFGENYEYSYNLSITSQGYTLPYLSGTEWQNGIKEKNTYESIIFPLMYKYFNKAIINKKGFFQFFDSPSDAERFIYLVKPNVAWRPFWSETPSNWAAGRISDFLEGKKD
ncbi:thermonuclease family protein [Mycoplasmopsis citelli]|uniref:thermonuclease family protein n=1 Tax=Mycoplasmopsis citelli TaxID=171281 RepID=UPI002114DC13|nr:thermonuclease family protein [Mycoplasmopsis citelli]UUD35941.1 thermonuclease family protein [Mycoplasmopsis citelli]